MLGVLLIETIVFAFIVQDATGRFQWFLTYDQRMPVVEKGITISPTELKAGCAGYSYIYTEYTTRRAPGWRAELRKESPCVGHK